ncbi:methyltransferase, TIGR00027 family [Thermomonospora echinospora]|uniref:S-adenosyl-L-methionine-dependent methyltransferase n=1 Tax=Thermomonospora echinospora TaxID=1992 RepID=A0A1H6DKL4_9ACTN|nr:class I SAM-dependent methyltransferase [Thermomonospora echinospora]SEG85880.1 methyltransferase, TIGR00027 family [Thermomonospora echinospora]
MDDAVTLRDVSDTALVAAVVRARESARRDPLFRDPYAEALAGERGSRLATGAQLRIISSGVVARTAVYDELITRMVREEGVGRVLNLGAGLDTRPYRLDLPEDLDWVEADLPGILDHKEQVLADARPRCRLTRARVDLSDAAARRRLLDEVSGGPPVLVVCEGLIAYLDADDVTGLARDLAERPALRWWALDMIGPLFVQVAKKIAGRRMERAEASLRFVPQEGAAFFRPLGWEPVDVRSSWVERRRLRREPPLMRAIWTVSPPRTREFFRQQGMFVLLRRAEDTGGAERGHR